MADFMMVFLDERAAVEEEGEEVEVVPVKHGHGQHLQATARGGNLIITMSSKGALLVTAHCNA